MVWMSRWWPQSLGSKVSTHKVNSEAIKTNCRPKNLRILTWRKKEKRENVKEKKTPLTTVIWLSHPKSYKVQACCINAHVLWNPVAYSAMSRAVPCPARRPLAPAFDDSEWPQFHDNNSPKWPRQWSNRGVQRCLWSTVIQLDGPAVPDFQG